MPNQLLSFHAEFPLRLLRTTRQRQLSADDIAVLRTIERTDWGIETLRLGNPHDEQLAARAVSLGAVACHGFGNLYAMSSHPGHEVVQHVNALKGNREDHVGSVTTTLRYVPDLFDWSQVPSPLNAIRVMDLIDTLFELGPFGFRGPAAKHLPEHLTALDNGVRTVRLVGPGYRCRSNVFLERCLQSIAENYLYLTSANLSHVQTGVKEEPSHYQLSGLQMEFGSKPGCVMVAHADEKGAREAYPVHLPMPATVLDFHQVSIGRDGRPTLRLERHGSLHVDDLRPVLDSLGLGVELGPRAAERFPIRRYTSSSRAA